MSGAIAWQVELAVRPGELENFRTLTREMVESTQGERGVLLYERFVSADGTVVYVYERYADSAAAVAHLLTFAHKYGARFAQLVERRRFIVFGTPSAELQRILDRFDATYLRPFDGFSLVQEEEGLRPAPTQSRQRQWRSSACESGSGSSQAL
jgi:quinol monooxygenase YgiN